MRGFLSPFTGIIPRPIFLPMTHEPAHPAQTKEFTLLMALLMSVVAISIDALLPALGVIGRDLGVQNQNHAQYLISFIFAGMAIGQLIAGPLSDALGRKKILYCGIALYLAGSVICFFASSLEIMLLGRFIQGVGVSGPYVSAVSIVRDKFSGRQMAKIMSLIMIIFMMVPALAPSLGQAVLFYTSWHGVFVLYIIYALVVTAWIFLRLEETLPKEHRIPFHVPNILDGFRQVFTNRITICYTVCMGLCFGGLMGYLNSAQQIFQDQFGTGEMFSVYFGGLAVVVAISSLLNSRLVEKHGMRYLSGRAYMAIVAASAVFLTLHAFGDIALWMFLGYAAVLFFCFGLVFGNMNALALEPMGHIAGIAAAITGSVSSIMSLTLGAIIGQLYDGTLIPLTTGILVLGILALGMMKLAHAGDAAHVKA